MKLLKSSLGFLIGLTLALLLTLIVGENPIHILSIILKSSFGSAYDLGLTLFYTTSLIFAGLSVSVAFKGGLFNIGAEGQLSMSALGMVVFAYLFPNIPKPLSYVLIFIAGSACGILWGMIPGILRAFRESHEVIVTMMMNFIAAAFASYVTLDLIKNPSSQNPESQPLTENFMFRSFDFVQSFFKDSPANFSLVIALAFAVFCYFFLYHTVWGYEIRASGQNERAAEIAGIHPKRMKILAMTLAGALAAGVALNEVLGSSGRYKIGFSPDYGFVGIAVALLARNHPLGILASAFLFGVLQKGAADLDIETELITRDFARVIQAILIFSVASTYFLKFKPFWKKRGRR